jgi:threonine dehydrogenase-like Zn-dependent dehydrogenase
MKAITIPGEYEVALTEREKPQAGPGEVLVKMHYVGFCGSDLNTWLGKNPMVNLPVIPGHEIGATIAAVGPGVPEGLRPGMPCTINPYTSCGHCPSCRNGRPNACRFNQTLGVQRDGAMCEYIVAPWQKVIADEALTPRQLALVEPMSVGFHAVSRAEVSDPDTVMVIGCGMIGIGALVRAVLRGARVIAVDVDNEKLELARELGACHTINSATEDVHTRLQALTDGEGPGVVIEAVGTPVTYRMAIDEAAFTGRVVCIGYAKTEVALDTKYIVMKEMDIRGSRNAMPEDFRAVMGYVKRHPDVTEKFISGVYAPAQAREALESWAACPGKVFRILIQF